MDKANGKSLKDIGTLSNNLTDLGLVLKLLDLMGYPYNLYPDKLDSYSLKMAEKVLREIENPYARELLKRGLERYYEVNDRA